MDEEEIKTVDAYSEISVWADCPECDEANEIAEDAYHDTPTVMCGNCDTEFKVSWDGK